MTYLFDNLHQVKMVLACSPFGLLTDFDGTLGEIVAIPWKARMSPLCRRYLGRLAAQLPLVAIISGRPALEIRRFIRIAKATYVGNNGLDRWEEGVMELHPGTAAYRSQILEALAALKGIIQEEGVFFEDKGIALGIHYRLSHQPQASREAIIDAISHCSACAGLEISEARKVVELRPPLGVDKGTAVRELVAKHGLRGAIYIGDGATDLAAFRALHELTQRGDLHGLAIGVLSDEAPQSLWGECDLTVRGIGEVERLLGCLVEEVAKLGS